MNYYNEIKKELINNEVYKKAKDYSKNKSDLHTCYCVGKLLSEAGKHYVDGIIKEYSKKLTSDLGKGYTPTRLRYFRRFFDVFSKYPTLSDKLSYSHYCEIMWLNEIQISYYINISINQNLSVRKLRNKIKNKEYERLDTETKNKLITKNEKSEIKDFIKHPIIIQNKYNKKPCQDKTIGIIIVKKDNHFIMEYCSDKRIYRTTYELLNI